MALDCPPAIIIQHDQGGRLDARSAKFERYRRCGTRVEIKGTCASSCTFYINLPPNRVCVHDTAVLVFHEVTNAHSKRRFEGATRRAMARYPAGVQAWIRKRGGLTSKLLRLRGKDLSRLVGRCSPKKWLVSSK